MKNIVYVLFAVLMLASCEKPNKIGFVDNGTIINDYQEKKDLETRFEIKRDAYTKKFDSIDQAFELEVQKFQEEAQKMSQNKAQEKYQELGQKKQNQDQQKQMEAQEFQQAFRTELDSIISKVKKFENEYGKTNGYTYILGTSDELATVLYGAEEHNITKIILEGLNAKYEKK